MISFLNIDLLTVGVAVAASVILGSLIFFRDTGNLTYKLFLYFTVVSAFWSVLNYLSYKVAEPIFALWLIRLVMFFAVLQALSFFQLMYVFPEREMMIPHWWKSVLVPLGAAVAFLTLTSLVFPEIRLVPGRAPQPVVAKGIIFFAAGAVGLVLSGIFEMFKKLIRSSKEQRRQFEYMFLGLVLMFALIITFNFILPTFADNTRFIPLSGVFIFPFVVLTGFAIIRHGLLNVKVISTEILTLILAIVTFIEIVFSQNLPTIIFRSSVFLLVLAFGILLVRSILQEVKQRQELQILTAKLQEANKQLKILDQARSEFITMASHQLRTPPATLKWYFAAILSGEFGTINPDLRQALEKVNLTNSSLISLIDNLLNVSRIERGKMEFVFEKTDIGELARVTTEQLATLTKAKNLGLKFVSPKKKLPEVLADREKIRQVISNLIDNAIKYTRQGGVTVSAEQTKDSILVKVNDTGKGVTAKEAGRIFAKFGRGEGATKFSAGLGIGLYLARVIVEQHQGKIWVESKGKDQGATFIFSLPIKSKLQATSFIYDMTKAIQKSG